MHTYVDKHEQSVKVHIWFCTTLKELFLSADDINNAKNKQLDLNGMLGDKGCLLYCWC